MPDRRPSLARTGDEAAERVRRMLRVAPPRKIFVPCREHVGDIVNTTAGLACLRAHFPSAYLVVEVGERAASVLENFPGLDEIRVRPTHQGLLGKIAHVRWLKRQNFDLAVIFDDSNSHVLFAKLGGIPIRVGIWRGVKYEHLYCAYVPYRREMHEIRDHCRCLLEMLGCDISDFRPRLYPTSRDREVAESALRDVGLMPGKRLIGVHPGGSEARRRWPVDSFASLIDGLRSKADVLLLGGEADRAAIEEVSRRCSEPPRTLDRPLTLLQFAVMCSALDLLICGDTGPMHIAATMGTRVLALYGPAYPEHTGPFGPGHLILQESCECPERSTKVCPGECLHRLRPERVLEAATSALNREAEVV